MAESRKQPSSPKFDERKRDEIALGEKIAAGESEAIWGWGTPAGKLRANGAPGSSPRAAAWPRACACWR